MREFLSRTPKKLPHRRNNFDFTAQHRRTDICCFVSEWVQRVLSRGFERTFRQISVQDSWHRSKRAAHTATGFNSMFKDTRTTGRATYTRKRYLSRRLEFYIESALRVIYDACNAARSASSNRDGGLRSRTEGHDNHEATRSCGETVSLL